MASIVTASAWLLYDLHEKQASQITLLAVAIEKLNENTKNVAEHKVEIASLNKDFTDLRTDFEIHIASDRKVYRKINDNFKLDGRH